MRILDRDILLEINRFPPRYELGSLSRFKSLAIAGKDGGLERDFTLSTGLIDDCGLYMDNSLFGCDFRRSNENAPLDSCFAVLLPRDTSMSWMRILPLGVLVAGEVVLRWHTYLCFGIN